MLNPKVMEAWFTLMTEAARGSSEGQAALKSLAEAMTGPDEMNRWLARFMPAVAASAQPEAFEAWLEDWWRMMGVVPRSRYLDLLERYDLLRSRLEKAEKTISKLRGALGAREPEVEAQQVLDMWDKMLQESLKVQQEWMKTWTAAQTSDPGDQAAGQTGQAEDAQSPINPDPSNKET